MKILKIILLKKLNLSKNNQDLGVEIKAYIGTPN